MLAVDRIGVPPALLTGLKHLASLHNPDFYEQEKLRFSTWNIPRFIRCYRETIDQLLLPRGLLEKAARLVADAGSRWTFIPTCRAGSKHRHPPSREFSAPNSERQPTPWPATTWGPWLRHPVRARQSSAAPLLLSTKSPLL